MGFGRLPGLASYEIGPHPGPRDLHLAAAGYRTAIRGAGHRPVRPLPPGADFPYRAPLDAGHAPLFSAPARPAPSGFAAVSGEVSTDTSEPAAWATVQIKSGADTYLTLADQLGRYAAYLPYPEALPPLTGSPPDGSQPGQLTWPITVSVGYQPSAQTLLTDAAADDPPELGHCSGRPRPPSRSAAGSNPASLPRSPSASRLLLMLQVVPA